MIAFDPVSKVVMTFVVGKRNQKEIDLLIRTVNAIYRKFVTLPRAARILEILSGREQLIVTQVAESFEVGERAITRDIKFLKDNGLILPSEKFRARRPAPAPKRLMHPRG